MKRVPPTDPVGGRPGAPSPILFSEPGAAGSVQGLDQADVRGSGVAPTTDEFEVGIGGMGRGGEASVLDIAAGAEARVGYVQAVAATEAASPRTTASSPTCPAVIAAAEDFWNAPRRVHAGRRRVRRPSAHAGDQQRGAASPVLVGRVRRDLVPPRVRRQRARPQLRHRHAQLLGHHNVHLGLQPELGRARDARPGRDAQPAAHWIASDIHTLFGTSSLTGDPAGRWYSVNDYAMTRLVNDYVRFTGDTDFLDEDAGRAAGRRAPRQWAEAWKALRHSGPLADYGEIDNLLECVSSYTHEVASLNAANVWCLRTVAEPARAARPRRRAPARRGRRPRRARARPLPRRHRLLRRRPARRHPAAACGTATTSASSAPRSPPTCRADSRGHGRVLPSASCRPRTGCARSPRWDPDASYSVRPDHQWNGAYPAWPADAARSLIALGAPDVALAWLPGLARSANQGPTGQAHFVEEAQPGINGGARKAPPQLPYINDWACSSSGAWVALVLEAVFGVRRRGGAAHAHPGGRRRRSGRGAARRSSAAGLRRARRRPGRSHQLTLPAELSELSCLQGQLSSDKWAAERMRWCPNP